MCRHWDFRNAVDAKGMFSNCKRLRSVLVADFSMPESVADVVMDDKSCSLGEFVTERLCENQDEFIQRIKAEESCLLNTLQEIKSSLDYKHIGKMTIKALNLQYWQYVVEQRI